MRLKDTFAIPQFVIPKHFATVYLTMNKEGEIIMIDKSNEAMHMNYANGCGSAPQPAARKRYVQHISGQGKKWEVMEPKEAANVMGIPCLDDEWPVQSNDGRGWHSLPKSEYNLLPPVKRWVDVTAECSAQFENIIHAKPGGLVPLIRTNGRLVDGYRLRRVVKPFIIDGYLKDFAVLLVEEEQEVSDGV